MTCGEATLCRMPLNLLRNQKSAKIGFAAEGQLDGLKNEHLQKSLSQSDAYVLAHLGKGPLVGAGHMLQLPPNSDAPAPTLRSRGSRQKKV